MDAITSLTVPQTQPYQARKTSKLAQNTCKLFGPFSALIAFFVISLIILSSTRLCLMLWQSERLISKDWLYMLTQGLRVDISSLCYLSAFPFLVSCFYWLTGKGRHVNYWFCRLWLITMLSLLVYLETITPTFISEYDLRPNRLLIEYLIYPQEVFSMLFNGYKLEILISSVILVITINFSLKLYDQFEFERYQQGNTTKPSSTMQKTLLISLLFVFILLGARASFGHRPMNPAMVSFSNDHLLNDLILNSAYSVAFAAKQLTNEHTGESYYGNMPKAQIIEHVRQATMAPLSAFSDPEHPSSKYLQASYQGSPKNLVILLQESLGARYVGGLGGLPLTPHLDQIMQQGWNFTNLYATGTRSVRGIEAITTGFTPTPNRAVVKLNKSQKNFFTLASFLKKQNYHTQFIYGGESHFDNMKSFFLGNGFEDIVDLPKFNKVDFEGSWGASDEDLYDQAHHELTQLAQQDKPFFSLVFTSSNHSPYDFPDNKIALYDHNKNTRNNAAKYADYALGQFITKAKKSNYWQNTIFIVVADHDSRVAGASLVPIEHFKIPGVIFGQDIKARHDNRLISQIDLAPTLLSLLGTSGYTPMLGHDLTQPVPTHKQRAMMQYDKNFAYMNTISGIKQVTILQPEKSAKTFNYQQRQLTPTTLDTKQAITAKATVLFGSQAYLKQWFQ